MGGEESEAGKRKKRRRRDVVRPRFHRTSQRQYHAINSVFSVMGSGLTQGTKPLVLEGII